MTESPKNRVFPQSTAILNDGWGFSGLAIDSRPVKGMFKNPGRWHANFSEDVIFCNSSHVSTQVLAQTYMGYHFTSDCWRAKAGYEWAKAKASPTNRTVNPDQTRFTMVVWLKLRKTMKRIILLTVALVSGCAAISLVPDAERVEIAQETPKNCKKLGDVVGTQGSWFTGDYTSNKNLMIGARNDLRNQAHKMGGNVIVIENTNNSTSGFNVGTNNTTVVGAAYRCPG